MPVASHALVPVPAPKPSASLSAYQFVLPVAPASLLSASPLQFSSVSSESQTSCAPGLIEVDASLQSVEFDT